MSPRTIGPSDRPYLGGVAYAVHDHDPEKMRCGFAMTSRFDGRLQIVLGTIVKALHQKFVSSVNQVQHPVCVADGFVVLYRLPKPLPAILDLA